MAYNLTQLTNTTTVTTFALNAKNNYTSATGPQFICDPNGNLMDYGTHRAGSGISHVRTRVL